MTPRSTGESVADDYAAYFDCMKRLTEISKRLPRDPAQIPAMPGMLQEPQVLANVLGFLAGRRSQLRRIILSTASPAGVLLPPPESGADRADQILSYYMIDALHEWTQSPKNWTVHNSSKSMSYAMRGLLCDLHLLADTAEIQWKTVLKDGEELYKLEIQDME